MISILDLPRREYDSLMGVSIHMLWQMHKETSAEVNEIEEEARVFAAKKNGLAQIESTLRARREM